VAWRQFNWMQDKVDEILDPVIKMWQSRQSQMRMDQFYSTQRIAVFKSVRLQNAIAKVSGNRNPVRAFASSRSSGKKIMRYYC
jgi:DNA excision repair protein ERCC-5